MKIIDLTLELHDGLITYAGHPPIQIKEQSTFESSKKRYIHPCEGFESRLISFSDHSGTHVDAPLHFIKGGDSAENIPVEKMFGEALILDVSNLKRPDEPVTKELLEEAEQKQGVYVEKDDIVLIRIWSKKWGDEGFFEALALDESAGKWLADKKVRVVGLDLPNVDVNHNMHRGVHLDLLGNHIYIVENLINLDQLPNHSRFMFFALPLKLKNATASPVRAVAVLDAQLI
jgi:arylformamidase